MSKTDTGQSVHKTVLLHEAIDGLNLFTPKKAGEAKSTVIDATFGGGGHSMEICKRFPATKIIAFDQDKSALKRGEQKFKDLNCNAIFINKNFRDLDKAGVEKVDGIIFDLGLSSDQLENSGRGFSFLKDEPLLMTMKENPGKVDVTAIDVVNTWSEENLANIIFGYGEEKFSRRIAKGIVDARQKKEIKTTFDLEKIIEDSLPGKYKKGRIHCATKTFQALRIAVNDELGALKEGLQKGFELLKSEGRMSVISFHSLEDRVVKRFFKEQTVLGKAKLINKKIITPSIEEIKNNKRSRSAKLRILEKI